MEASYLGCGNKFCMVQVGLLKSFHEACTTFECANGSTGCVADIGAVFWGWWSGHGCQKKRQIRNVDMDAHE